MSTGVLGVCVCRFLFFVFFFYGLFSALHLCVVEEPCRIFLALSGSVLPSVLQAASFRTHLKGQSMNALYTEIRDVSVSVLPIATGETYSPCDGID